MPPSTKPRLSCTFPGCQLSFIKRNHLERHWRTHTQVQEYSCPVCLRRFSRLDSHDRHVKKLHPEIDLMELRHRTGRVSISHDRLDSTGEDSTMNNTGDFADDSLINSERETNDSNLFDQQGMNSSVWLPHYEAAEQISRLRHYPTTPITLPSNADSTQHIMASPTRPMDSVEARNTTESASVVRSLNSIGAWSPSIVSNENSSNFLDVDPIICSLLWRTLEASITEASGSSYVTPYRLPEDTATSVDLMNPISTRASISMPSFSGGNTSGGGVEEDGRNRRDGELPLSVSIMRQSRSGPSYSVDHPELSSSNLGPEAAHMVAEMQSDLYSVRGHIEAPVEPEKGLATSCFWLCRRHFLPTSVFTLSQRVHKVLDDGHALVMNLIAIGSLWHQSEVGRKWGADIWSFTLRIVWSRGMRNVQDDSTVSMLMSILMSGHSYVLMSCDPAVHRLGRRAWLFCHLLHDVGYTTWKYRNNEDKSVDNDEDLDHRLSKVEYRAELRNNVHLLERIWQQWRDLEEQIRVAWGICIYDSQQAAWLDMRPSLQIDVSRQHPEPASESLFEAKTAQTWLQLYETDIPKRRNLTFIMKILLQPFPCSSEHITWSSSQQASYNIIEAIYSSWLLDKATKGTTSEYWNMSTSIDIVDLGLFRSVHALANWRLFWASAIKEREQEDKYCLLIRWHCIHMNFCLNDVDVVEYVRDATKHLSSMEEIKEVLRVPRKKISSSVEDLSSSARGRRALWHAGRISTELSKLPRVTSTPIHVAQAAYESMLLLATFALIVKKKQDQRQGRAFELVGSSQEEDDTDQWVYIGLAGFLDQESIQPALNSDSSKKDWGNVRNSTARRWIMEGEVQDAFISGLSIQLCSMALQDLAKSLDENRLLWCLAEDYRRLINGVISLL